MNVSKIIVNDFDEKSDLGVMYRVEADWRAGWDPYDDVALPATLTGFKATAFPVVKLTPKGKWIRAHGERKFILNDARKRFACETVELAVKGFKARRECQIRLLTGQLNRAKKELARLEQLTASAETVQSPDLLAEVF
jgi:hypothetical protein